jgi:hypothetical protein
MQFTIGVTVLECSFVKDSHGPLGVNMVASKKKKCSHKLQVVGANGPTRMSGKKTLVTIHSL